MAHPHAHHEVAQHLARPQGSHRRDVAAPQRASLRVDEVERLREQPLAGHGLPHPRELVAGATVRQEDAPVAVERDDGHLEGVEELGVRDVEWVVAHVMRRG